MGINEVHNFGKYLITGPRARDWLDRIMAGRIPKPGPPVADADAVAQGQADRGFHRVLPGRRGIPAHRLLRRAGLSHALVPSNISKDGVTVENISDKRNGFQIAGPKAREVLAACTRADISDMRFMDVRRMVVGQ